MDDRTKRIAQLNDLFRKAGQGGQIYKTRGIDALPAEDQLQIVNLVQTFNTFSADNDPYGEHDFGKIEYKGQKVFWKIDCYDNDLKKGSEDPANPDKTVRVMTIMLANEY